MTLVNFVTLRTEDYATVRDGRATSDPSREYNALTAYPGLGRLEQWAVDEDARVDEETKTRHRPLSIEDVRAIFGDLDGVQSPLMIDILCDLALVVWGARDKAATGRALTTRGPNAPRWGSLSAALRAWAQGADRCIGVGPPRHIVTTEAAGPVYRFEEGRESDARERARTLARGRDRHGAGGYLPSDWMPVRSAPPPRGGVRGLTAVHDHSMIVAALSAALSADDAPVLAILVAVDAGTWWPRRCGGEEWRTMRMGEAERILRGSATVGTPRHIIAACECLRDRGVSAAQMVASVRRARRRVTDELIRRGLLARPRRAPKRAPMTPIDWSAKVDQ